MLKKIYDYKVGDKVVTPTGAIATVVKETYKGERLILKYDEVPEVARRRSYQKFASCRFK